MSRLTEQEKQDIIRYLEANKPLPEKYRFLLFKDKRQVELVWNGKTNEGIALPDGTYFYSVLKINPDGTQEEVGGLEHGKVEAVQFDQGKIYLIINGKRFSIDSIVEIS